MNEKRTTNENNTTRESPRANTMTKGLAAVVMASAIGIACSQGNVEYSKPKTAPGKITKSYTAQMTVPLWVDELYVPIEFPAQHIVEVTAEDCKQQFDDPALYKRFSDGERVDVVYRTKTRLHYTPMKGGGFISQTDAGCEVLDITSATQR